tara:strand:+ start:1453 stop:1602 length:150 start_codon:yes stop_codon:yes gene_type:complete
MNIYAWRILVYTEEGKIQQTKKLSVNDMPDDVARIIDDWLTEWEMNNSD